MIEITQEKFDELMENMETFLILFYHTSVIPSLHMIDNMCTYEGLPLFKANIEEFAYIGHTLDIKAVPSIVYIHKGNLYSTKVGKVSKERIEEWIRRL